MPGSTWHQAGGGKQAQARATVGTWAPAQRVRPARHCRRSRSPWPCRSRRGAPAAARPPRRRSPHPCLRHRRRVMLHEGRLKSTWLLAAHSAVPIAGWGGLRMGRVHADRATATATSMQAPAAMRAQASVRAFTYVSGVRYAGPGRLTWQHRTHPLPSSFPSSYLLLLLLARPSHSLDGEQRRAHFSVLMRTAQSHCGV